MCCFEVSFGICDLHLNSSLLLQNFGNMGMGGMGDDAMGEFDESDDEGKNAFRLL